MDLQEIKSKLATHKPEITKNYSVHSIGVFGSYARGEQNSMSDVDILVEFSETPSFFKFLDLEEYLENLLGIKVDLVTRNALKPKIGQFILDEIIPI